MRKTILHQHIEAFQQQRRIQAGSLIVSVFGDAILPRGGRIWLGSLIRLLALLNVNERLIRTSIFRLAKDEWLATEASGRRADYFLTASGRRRFEQAAEHIYAGSTALWDRRWRLILTVGEIAAKQRELLRRALFWQGFGLLSPTCFIHPSVDLSAAFDALTAEGLEDHLPALMPLLAADTELNNSASQADLVRQAWNLEELASAYENFVQCYQPMLKVLRNTTPDESEDEHAFLLRTLLIHNYRRLLLRDPGLPDVLLPKGWPGQKARTLCKEMYLHLLPASERHLQRTMQTANGDTPAALTMLTERFQSTASLSK